MGYVFQCCRGFLTWNLGFYLAQENQRQNWREFQKYFRSTHCLLGGEVHTWQCWEFTPSSVLRGHSGAQRHTLYAGDHQHVKYVLSSLSYLSSPQVVFEKIIEEMLSLKDVHKDIQSM